MYPFIKIILIVIISLIISSIIANDQLIDSIKIETTKAEFDTAQLNRILIKLDAYKIRELKETDSIALIILDRFKSVDYDDGIHNTLNFLAILNYKRGNFKIALQYHKELLFFLDNKNVKKQQLKANVFRFITGEYFNIGQFDTAIVFGEKAITEFVQLNDLQNIASTLNLLGGIYLNKGNYKKASEKLFESLKLKEKLNDTLGFANAYNNIGLIYDSQGRYEEAINMYYRALLLFEKINDEQGLGRAYNNMAICKKNQLKYSESLELFIKSLEIDIKQKNNDEIGKTQNNIGILYLDLNDASKGISYFNQALDALNQSGNDNGIAAVYINLGRANLMQNRYSTAESFYKKSLQLSEKIGSNEWLRDSYKGLFSVAKATNRNSEALSFLEKYKVLDDSLRSLENLNKLDQLKIEYETEQKEKEIVLLSKDNELNVLKLKKQESYTHLLLTIIISGAIIILLISLYVHRLKVDKNLLIQKNAEITQQKEELQAHRDMLEATNAELNQQKEELLTQSEQIEKQNQLISGINRRMTESIEYASLIQQTLLPNTGILSKYFRSHFILYKPKDIVSGDLYWVWENNGNIIFAIADCTGHGVAGAFVSVMAISLLKDAVGVNRLYEPKEIAKYLYSEMIKNSGSSLNSMVGIDFIICKYDPEKKELTYCGNHMNFIAVSTGKTELVKAGKMLDLNSIPLSFNESSLALAENDKVYFYTDGYTDQLSGVKRKKMGRTELQKLLVSIENQPHQLQQAMLDDFYNKWKGNFEQVDDVLVLSLQV